MPMKYVEPELFLTHRGVNVYHTYGDDLNDRRDYWYSTDDKEEDDEFQFDVRKVFHNLYKREVDHVPAEEDGPSIEETVRAGIDRGLIRVPLWQQVSKIGSLIAICHNPEVVPKLIDFACNQTAQTVKSLELKDQIAFLISQIGNGTLEELLNMEIVKEARDANKTEAV